MISVRAFLQRRTGLSEAFRVIVPSLADSLCVIVSHTSTFAKASFVNKWTKCESNKLTWALDSEFRDNYGHVGG